MGWRTLGLALVVSASAGCFTEPDMLGGDDEPPRDTEGTGSASKGDTSPDTDDASTSGVVSTTTDPSSGSSGTTTDGTSSDGSTGLETECGDGIVEGDEECEVGEPGCTAQCLPQGSRVWLTLLDDVADDEGSQGQDLLVTEDQRILVAAHQEDYQPNVQVVVRHLDSDGGTLETEALPGETHSRLALAELNGRHHLLAADGFDPWLAQLDSMGTLAWRTDWDNDESFEAHDAASDGSLIYVYLLDAIQGMGLVPTLRAINAQGAEQWDATFSGHYVRPMVAAAADGVYVQHGVGEAEVDTERETCRVSSTGVTSGCWTFDLGAEVHALHVVDDRIYVAAGEVNDGLSTWVVAAFGTGGDELWRARVFEDAAIDRDHQPNALTTTEDGRLIVAGSALGSNTDIVAAWATLDAVEGEEGPTWTDDELGPVRNVAVLQDGTLVSSGSMPLDLFPKPLFVTKQLL